MSETMLERMEKRSCDNRYYIPNLTTALKRAVEQKDIEAIITLASELERFKVICGFTPAIQQFEESLKHYGREMGLLDHPAIERALNTIPQKTCGECECGTVERNMEKHPQQRNAEAILENIPRNSKLGSIMDRLEKIEEQVTILEKMDTEPQKAIELYHVFPKRPELCKPKREDE